MEQDIVFNLDLNLEDLMNTSDDSGNMSIASWDKSMDEISAPDNEKDIAPDAVEQQAMSPYRPEVDDISSDE